MFYDDMNLIKYSELFKFTKYDILEYSIGLIIKKRYRNNFII